MRILLSNKFYYRRGGDCIYTLELERLLRQHGHDVAVFAMQHPDNIPTPWQAYFPSEANFRIGPKMVEAMSRPLGTREVKERFDRLIRDFSPDVVHLGNIHSQLSPILAETAHDKGIRVVWTLHDYKLLCPRYDCMRPNGEVCEACFSNQQAAMAAQVKAPDPGPCLKYHCLKDSLVASLIGWAEMKKWNRDRLTRITDMWICPSSFMLQKMQQGGFPIEKLTHLCNFIDVSKCLMEDYAQREDYYCYVGRLSHEKGVHTLIDAAARLPYRLIIIGDGPLKGQLQKQIQQLQCHDRIQLAGKMDWPQIKQYVGHARMLVIPSEWYENNPLTVLEAQCLGTPVLGARIGGIPELIHPITGSPASSQADGDLFSPKDIDELAQKIETLWCHPFDYSQIAGRSQQQFCAETYYTNLMKLYSRS
ncbi:MAG: glycosyltransferase [Bacteroidales bacterium]|nr:glycosyltransferase [Bacteroidales bacterium]